MRTLRNRGTCLLVGWVMLAGGLAVRAQTGSAASAAVPADQPLKPMAADADPSFEVATVKPFLAGQSVPPPGGRQYSVPGITVKDLLASAYGLHAQQVIGGPDWIGKDHFAIAGIPDAPGHPSEEQWHIMVRKLLASRFQLTLHHEQRELPAYGLSVAKGGLKIAKNTSGEGMDWGISVPRDAKMFVTNATMADVVRVLGTVVLGRPVLDHTGLKGGFDFKLTFSTEGLRVGFAPPPRNGWTSPSANLFTAMQELGLKLEAVKAPVDVIVIDHVEQPSEN